MRSPPTLVLAAFALLVLAGPAPAAAQAAASADGAVEIESDTMEVIQDQQRAIFSGNVDAVRGNMRLTSDTLTVEYAETGSGDGARTEIRYLDARGNVVIRNKGQTVESDWAKMDVGANTVVMGGIVVLKEGRSVFLGTKLEIDLTSGKSTLVGTGRVRGLFFPSD